MYTCLISAYGTSASSLPNTPLYLSPYPSTLVPFFLLCLRRRCRDTGPPPTPLFFLPSFLPPAAFLYHGPTAHPLISLVSLFPCFLALVLLFLSLGHLQGRVGSFFPFPFSFLSLSLSFSSSFCDTQGLGLEGFGPSFPSHKRKRVQSESRKRV